MTVPAFNPEHIHTTIQPELLRICGEYGWWWADHDDPLTPVTPAATEVLGAIAVPLLIVTAEYDALVCREVADLLAQSVAHARKVDIPSASHFMLMERPAEFNATLLQFLSDVDNEAPPPNHTKV